MTTNFTVTTAAELTATLAAISAGGGDAANDTDYVIALTNTIALANASVNLAAGSTLRLEGPGAGAIDAFGVTGVLIEDAQLTGTITLDSGTLTNDGWVTGSVYGLAASGDTVTNSGSIANTAAASNGVNLVAGQVVNGSAAATQALISGGTYGVYIKAAGTVVNDGTISGSGMSAYGIVMGSGDVTNGTAAITSAVVMGGATGVAVRGAGDVTNYGTVIGDTAAGVYLNTGTVTNGSATDTVALIDGAKAGSSVGIELGSPGGSVINYGTIGGHLGYGVALFGGGMVTNAASGVIKSTTDGVLLLKSGDVINDGSIAATGLSTNSPAGVFFEDGGTLTNQADGSVSGLAFGVAATSAPASIANDGVISGGLGVELAAGGSVDNGDAADVGASIVGNSYGVRLTQSGSVTNFGTISGQVGVFFDGAAGTLTNAGAINSSYGADGVAVQFGAGAERLVVEPGASFDGQVVGGGTDSTTAVEFAAGSAGSLSGLVGTGGTVQLASGAFSFASVTSLAIDRGSSFIVTDSGEFGDVRVDGSVTANTAFTITTVEAASTGSLDLGAGAMLDVTTDQAAGSTIDFTGRGGTLKIENAAVFGTGAGTLGYTGPAIAGFAAGQTIDLANLTEAGAQIDSFDPGTGLLQLSSGTQTATLKLAGGFAGEYFHLQADAGTGTDVTVDGTPCYCRGTLILTEHGARPVESLAIGERLVTHSGAKRPIHWIGRRSYSGAYAADHPDVLPVLIRQDALADGVPHRDLLVSPLHAMFLDGVLVPALHLVNGISILQITAADQVDYIHLELDTHDVIFAEGAASESFVDDCSRGMFQNAAEYGALYPGAVRQTPHYCAPRLVDGAALEVIRLSLAARGDPAADALADSQLPGRLLGVVDVVDHARVAGWAQDEQRPERPVALRILCNGVLLADIVANRYRADLEKAGVGRGRHSFDFTIPDGLSPFERHVIQVERASDGQALGLSPQVLKPAMRLSPAVTDALTALLDAVPPGGAQDAALGFLVRQTGRMRQRRAAQQRPGKAAQKRALVIDDAMPDAGRDAGSQAILSHMSALQVLGYEVSFAAAQEFDAAGETLTGRGIACCHAPWYSTVEEVLRRQAGRFDVVYLHRVGNAAKYLTLARAYQPAARLLYSVADLHHVRLARQAAVEARPELVARSRHARLLELTAVLSADATLTHSHDEAALIRREVNGARVVVAPWHVGTRPRPASFAQRSGVAFVGGFAHAPNVDAARWLAEAIMPLVWQTAPGIACTLIGSAMPDTIRRLAGPLLHVAGAVAEVWPVLDGMRLTVAPLRFGAGVKGKVVESLAAGLPCAMTGIAAEGLTLPPALQPFVGNGAAEIAAAICRLHEDAALNLAVGEAGRSFVAATCSEAAVVDALRRAIEGRFAEAGAVIQAA